MLQDRTASTTDRRPRHQPFQTRSEIEHRGRHADTASWVLVAVMTVGCIVLGYANGFVVDAWRAIPVCAALAILSGAIVFGRAQQQPRLTAGATAFLQMTLFTVNGVVLAYVLAAQAGPLCDQELAAADRYLGFDWAALYRTLDTVPIAIWIGGIAYHSLTLQMVVCIVALSATGRDDRLRMMVAAAVSSGIVTILISGAVPAMGNVFDPAGYHSLWPSVAWLEHDLITGLRDGSVRKLDLTQLMGIVTFPSYHATLPIILAWAQRDVARLRIIAPVWAVVTILATPVFGGHYGVDVLAGIGLAVGGLAVAPALTRRRSTTP
jgi:hypothetical protein